MATRDISERIRGRLRRAGKPFAANDSIAHALRTGDLDKLENEVARKAQALLDALVIDTANDHNTRGTARRIARMYLREVFSGRYTPEPTITDFPNVRRLDELYTVGPITVRSTCSHHFCPIEGQLWVGVVPGDRVIGLSKFARLARHTFSRPQIQEEAVMQLADQLERLIKPKGLAVVIRARHTCMTWRGVQEPETVMTNSVTRGYMREAHATRLEFFSLIESQGFIK